MSLVLSLVSSILFPFFFLVRLFHQFRKLFSSNKNIYIDEALYTAHVTRHASEMIHKAKKQIKNKVPQDQNGFLNRVQIVKGVLDAQLHMLAVHLQI